MAVSIDDSGRAREAPGIGNHGTTVTHGDSRKRNAASPGSDGERIHRMTERNKLTGLNQYPTIVGLVKTQPFNYLGVINSTTALNLSMNMSTCGLDLNHLQHLGLRPASSCDTRCHGTPFYIFNSATKNTKPKILFRWTPCRL